MQARLHRWRLNLVTGGVREEQLSEGISEFGMINPGYAGDEYRYTYAATGKPGWFLFDGLVKHDLQTGAEERFAFDDGVYGSETAMARGRSTGEDDGYLVRVTTDMNADASYCLIFDAARVNDGPVCKLALPERVSSGTHSTWAAGAELRRWHQTIRAEAIGLEPGGAVNAVGRISGCPRRRVDAADRPAGVARRDPLRRIRPRLPISTPVLARRLRAMTTAGCWRGGNIRPSRRVRNT